MAKVERFEGLIAWQIQRAPVSIMSNIVEKFYGGNPRGFHQFLSIAKASCVEARSQLYVALDAAYLNEQSFRILMALARETGEIIGGLRVFAKRRRDTK